MELHEKQTLFIEMYTDFCKKAGLFPDLRQSTEFLVYSAFYHTLCISPDYPSAIVVLSEMQALAVSDYFNQLRQEKNDGQE